MQSSLDFYHSSLKISNHFQGNFSFAWETQCSGTQANLRIAAEHSMQKTDEISKVNSYCLFSLDQCIIQFKCIHLLKDRQKYQRIVFHSRRPRAFSFLHLHVSHRDRLEVFWPLQYPITNQHYFSITLHTDEDTVLTCDMTAS